MSSNSNKLSDELIAHGSASFITAGEELTPKHGRTQTGLSGCYVYADKNTGVALAYLIKPLVPSSTVGVLISNGVSVPRVVLNLPEGLSFETLCERTGYLHILPSSGFVPVVHPGRPSEPCEWVSPRPVIVDAVEVLTIKEAITWGRIQVFTNNTKHSPVDFHPLKTAEYVEKGLLTWQNLRPEFSGTISSEYADFMDGRRPNGRVRPAPVLSLSR